MSLIFWSGFTTLLLGLAASGDPLKNHSLPADPTLICGMLVAPADIYFTQEFKFTPATLGDAALGHSFDRQSQHVSIVTKIQENGTFEEYYKVAFQQKRHSVDFSSGDVVFLRPKEPLDPAEIMKIIDQDSAKGMNDLMCGHSVVNVYGRGILPSSSKIDDLVAIIGAPIATITPIVRLLRTHVITPTALLQSDKLEKVCEIKNKKVVFPEKIDVSKLNQKLNEYLASQDPRISTHGKQVKNKLKSLKLMDDNDRVLVGEVTLTSGS